MTASITIPPHHAAHVRAYLDAGPLGLCTTVGHDGGALVVRTDRDLALLSTGERLAWDALGALLAGDLLDRPDVCLPLADLLARAALERGAA